MHWLLQETEHPDQGTLTLIETLERAGLPHSFHKVVPFIGEIMPDIDIDGPVIVIGSYSLRHVARRKGWVPGSFDLASLTYQDHIDAWGTHMLNADAITSAFKDVPKHLKDDEPFFIRPIVDSKFFAGKIETRPEFLDWWHKVVVLEEDDGSTLRGSTLVMIASPKMIQTEYRVWVVDGRVVTASLYKRGGRVIYDAHVDEEIIAFAQARADEWAPARAYVVDIARCSDGLYVIETNTINAAGFYAGNVPKLVEALENMMF